MSSPVLHSSVRRVFRNPVDKSIWSPRSGYDTQWANYPDVRNASATLESDAKILPRDMLPHLIHSLITEPSFERAR
jgi:hypothetical protein